MSHCGTWTARRACEAGIPKIGGCEVLGWEPSVPLMQGLEPTYRWIEKQVASAGTFRFFEGTALDA